MKRNALFLILIIFPFVLVSQDFYHSDFDTNKKYIILTNPTIYNLKTVQYLLKNKLLHVNTQKTGFVGVFYEGQAYDFSETARYISENKITNFNLQKVTGKLNADNIFTENECTLQLKKIFQNSSGVFFFGGPDIQPLLYGEANTLSDVTDPGRHLFETTFQFHLLGSYRNESFRPFLEDNRNYLVTGFCLGMQTMNVATGGTLIQDIPSEIYNTHTPEETVKTNRESLYRNYWQEISNDTMLMGINFHTICYTDNPFFTRRVKASKKKKILVLSSHHQSVEKIGKGLQVTALSADGKIIEGFAHMHYPNVFAVQFHPEVPALYEDINLKKFSPDDNPESYNDIIGKQSEKFHKKYWALISRVLK